jgi:putative CRISPR-associated endoribonuclease cas6
MLGTITLTLQIFNSGSLPEFPGRFLHAAVFSLISSIDKAQATIGTICLA